MRICDGVRCIEFPCQDVVHDQYTFPAVDVNPDHIRMVIISECPAAHKTDNYYAGGVSLFEKTTLQAFQDAGAPVESFQDVLDFGVYLTTAVKCGKTGYGIKTGTIDTCSHLLEAELAFFSEVIVYLLMGDVAINAFNRMAKRQGYGRVIPAGSTYKLRGTPFYYTGRRVIPSYLQAGPAFFIEKSKRKMVAEDISEALAIVNSYRSK